MSGDSGKMAGKMIARKTALDIGDHGDPPPSPLRAGPSGRFPAWHVPDAPEGNPIANAMTVDVEDYFHVSAFAGVIDRADWGSYESRIESNTRTVLDVFAACGLHATFFMLGWVAERYPELVREIIAAGHEVGSHGCAHDRVTALTPKAFREDVRRSRKLLEDIGGALVTGYRAPSFSVNGQTFWALAILAEEGYKYSSSVYPVHHDHYGMPEAPRFPFQPLDGFVEFPVTTVRLFGRNLPCGGGGYFRLLPYRYSRWALRQTNAKDGQPCMFYIHPWELDPGQPRVSGVSARSRFRHYTNLGRMAGKLRAVVQDFAWDRADRVLGLGSGDAR
jgi:polysaccharide deacetylase family protein (PEP-CTERM system associated)